MDQEFAAEVAARVARQKEDHLEFLARQLSALSQEERAGVLERARMIEVQR